MASDQQRLPLIYLPGMDGSPGAGDMVLANFPDHPSFQLSYPIGGTQSFAELEAKLLDDADRAGFETFVAIGESFGGALAQRVAFRAPERVRAIVTISSFLWHPAPLLGRIVGYAMRHCPGWLLRAPVRWASFWLLARHLERSKRAEFYDAVLSMPMHDIGRRLHTLQGFDQRSCAASMRQAAFWIWGSRDRLIDVGRQREWLMRHRAEDGIAVIEGADHVIPRGRIEPLASHMRAFLERLTSEAG